MKNMILEHQHEDLFYAQDLWDVVNKGYTIPTNISSLIAAQKKKIKENQQKDA